MKPIKLWLSKRALRLHQWLIKDYVEQFKEARAKGYRDMVVQNTYEATFYILQGAQFIKSEQRKVPENKWDKLGYRTQWKVYLSRVPNRAIEIYKNGQAQANVYQFEIERRKLKRHIRKDLDIYR